MKELPKNLPECDKIDDFILRRLKRGLSTHILVTGLGGTGKSSFSVRTAERLSKRIKNGVEFNHKDIVDSFLKLLARLSIIKKPGEVIVIEEVSVLFPSRRAMTSDNVAVGRVLDTIRKRRVILISNAPLYTSVDLHMRAMANVLVECMGVIKKEKLVRLKAWKLQTNANSGKTYRRRFTRGRQDIIFHFSRKPDKTIWDIYEKDKDLFLAKTYQRLKQKAEFNERKEDRELGESNSIKKRNNDVWVRYSVKKQSIRRIANDVGVSERQISRILKDYKENNDFLLGKSENMTDKGKRVPI